MCDPISALLSVVGAGASLLGGSKKTAAPPPPAIAQATPGIIDTAPVIQSGPADDTKDVINTSGSSALVKQRKAGTSLGGLGRSSMTLEL